IVADRTASPGLYKPQTVSMRHREARPPNRSTASRLLTITAERTFPFISPDQCFNLIQQLF
uniref:Uncharacterized protein n=1 Tax=Esox lucius TaxID=8010 RepID=A0AAY5K4M0_ESOLU